MKRPPGLWILLSAGVLWLCFQDTHGIRATELIFGKSPTSTTEASSSDAGGEEAVPSAESANNSSNTTETAPSSGIAANSTTNSTKPTLTGNPQIDYVWDPNLPKELNGYNLSEYPFYERVPAEEIEFKCDGLHDGFYASVPHKCQVYHHCLFGTRYDFLCANYTAFDQKTFICQFVSEVDCENSKKYWHRNDALYQAASTTTERPLRRDIYTPPPSVAVADPITPLPSGTGVARRPPGRRPFPRRRPQVEYYDDYYYDDEYYEERPRPRKRPRPKPRPVYDDEYDADAEYDDERYERPRGGGRRNGGRRPYRRPNNRRRNKDRRKEDEDRRKEDDYDEDQEEVEDRFEDEDFIKAAVGKRRKGDRRKNNDDYLDDEPVENRKRPNNSSNKRRPPPSNEDYDTGRKRKPGKNRRPIQDEYDDDDSLQADEGYDRPRKGGHKQSAEDSRPIIKPATGTIYDRPRVAPKINLPVPKNAADKFAYKPLGGAKTTPPPPKPKSEEQEEELYDDYEEPPPKRSKNRRNKPQPSTEAVDTKPKPSRDHDETTKETKKHTTTAPRSRPHKEEESSERPSRLKYTPSKPKWGTTTTSTAKPVSEEYYDYYDEEDVKDSKETKHHKEEKQISSTTTSTTSTTTTTTTTTTPETPKSDAYVRIVKRPFLPSRGGNPYSARGLQPVGVKAEDKAPLENEEIQEENPPRNHHIEQTDESKSAFKPSPVIMKVALRKPVQLPLIEEDSYSIEPLPQINDQQASFRPTKEEEATFKPSPILVKIPVRKPVPLNQNAEPQEFFDSESSRQQNVKTGPRTTQKPKVIEPAERNPLDLNEYDVTLNDALNPTLPNLPVRSFPSAFGANDYVYNNFQRPRYVVSDTAVSQSNPDYVYQTKIRPAQRYEAPAQPSNRNNHYNIVTNGNYRHRESQPISQSQAFYSSY